MTAIPNVNTEKRIRTVLYGDQRISRAELEVLHTPSMQRLYGLRQLGLTDRIFIDASHARIHHVVGVLHQVDNLLSAIAGNLRHSNRSLRIGAKDRHQTFSAPQLANFVQERRPVVRFIGLLHDLTHAPFGHTVEDEIHLVGTKHDEPARQADAFYRLLCQLIAWLSVEVKGPDFEGFPEGLKPFVSQAGEATPPDASEVGGLARRLLLEVDSSKATACWRLSCREIAGLLAHLSCAMTALLHLEALHKTAPTEYDLPSRGEYPFQAAVRVALSETSFEPLLQEFQFRPNRDAFMLDIVGNTVCADLLDYAKRDSHFAGLRLDYDPDRIAENFTLVSHDASGYEVSHPQAETGSDVRERMPKGVADPFEGWCLRTAISLVSHKYRTDIPSELMNLLNVRFYLYERAIYHPTKCAAGSMLGTALQLLGWRGSATGAQPSLPAHLRFVGDDVFLHDIRAALNFILEWTGIKEKTYRIDAADPGSIANVDRVHNGLVPELLRLHVGETASEVHRELTASKLMLDRLTARRYFRPVWRALPSSTDTRLQAGADALAERFRQPDHRYEAERRIEMQSNLPLGTVTIHCPSRTTARKIANVLLTKPGLDGEDEICKLKDIGSLDGPIFGEHQKAVKAVEQMYGSMWRLTVYVAPEQLDRYQEIGNAAGQVVFKTIDVHGQFGDRPETFWKNDANLQAELQAKLVPTQSPPALDDSELSPLGEFVGRLSDQLLKSGRIANAPPELLAAPHAIHAEARERIERALVTALSSEAAIVEAAPAEMDPSQRIEQLIRLYRTHAKRLKREDSGAFKRDYAETLGKLSPEVFDDIAAQLQTAILQTEELDQRGSTVHHGYKFNEFREVLDALLRKKGVAPPSRVEDGLFGGSS